MRLHHGANHGGRGIGLLDDQTLRRCNCRHGVTESLRRSVATANVENQIPDPVYDRKLCTHPVGKKSVDGLGAQGSRGGDTEIYPRPTRFVRHHDLDAFAIGINARRQQQTLQRGSNERHGSDALAFERRQIAAGGRQILAHDEQPIGALGLRANQPHATPLRKGEQRRVRGSTDEVDRAIA